MQLYATYATICNYMMDKYGNFNFMQLYATVLVPKMYIGMITYLLVLTSVGTTK